MSFLALVYKRFTLQWRYHASWCTWKHYINEDFKLAKRLLVNPEITWLKLTCGV